MKLIIKVGIQRTAFSAPDPIKFNLLLDFGAAPIFYLEELSFPLEVSSASGIQMCQGIPQYVGEKNAQEHFLLERKMQSYGHLPLGRSQ